MSKIYKGQTCIMIFCSPLTVLSSLLFFNTRTLPAVHCRQSTFSGSSMETFLFLFLRRYIAFRFRNHRFFPVLIALMIKTNGCRDEGPQPPTSHCQIFGYQTTRRRLCSPVCFFLCGPPFHPFLHRISPLQGQTAYETETTLRVLFSPLARLKMLICGGEPY